MGLEVPAEAAGRALSHIYCAPPHVIGPPFSPPRHETLHRCPFLATMAKDSSAKAKAAKAAKAVKTAATKSHRKPRYSVVFHRPTTLKNKR